MSLYHGCIRQAEQLAPKLRTLQEQAAKAYKQIEPGNSATLTAFRFKRLRAQSVERDIIMLMEMALATPDRPAPESEPTKTAH